MASLALRAVSPGADEPRNIFLQKNIAGAGIAPAPGDYEPPDLLLVYPAVPKIISVL